MYLWQDRSFKGITSPLVFFLYKLRQNVPWIKVDQYFSTTTKVKINGFEFQEIINTSVLSWMYNISVKGYQNTAGGYKRGWLR